MLELPEFVSGDWDPRILAFRSGKTVNVFAVLTQRYTIIVDTLYSRRGVESLVEAVLLRARAARRDGEVEPALVVVNTHADWDHCWGNGAFLGRTALFPAPVMASQACLERMRSHEARAELDTKLREDAQRFAGASLDYPDLVFSGARCIDGGDLSVKLLPAPGHERDQLVVWIPEISVLLAADAVEWPIPFVEGTGHWKEMLHTLEDLAALHPRWIMPCHSPWLGKAALLERNLAYCHGVEERIRSWEKTLGKHLPSSPREVEEAVGYTLDSAVRELYSGPEWEIEQLLGNREDCEFYAEAHRRALWAAFCVACEGEHVVASVGP